MKDQVLQIASELYQLLISRGEQYTTNTIVQTLNDFETTTAQEMQRDFDNGDFADMDDLANNLKVYQELKEIININSITNEAPQKILQVYYYYETKYLNELGYRSAEQRQNYIETILSPMLLISLYLIDKIQIKLNARIFQKHIVKSSDKSELVLNFDNCLVSIDENHIKVHDETEILLSSNLSKIEEDANTITYLGNFNDGTQFRVIRPTDISLEHLKQEYDCLSAFSVASISRDQYAIHFVLFDPNNNTNVSSITKDETDQIVRLIEGCVLALTHDLDDQFIEFSGRLLNLINDATELSAYPNGPKILSVMRNNRQLYSDDNLAKL